MMNNADFWASVRSIIAEGFKPEGLQKMEQYAEDFISGRLVYQRFSPHEQHGCAAGGATNVIASLLAGAETGADSANPPALGDYERECQQGTKQEAAIFSPYLRLTVSHYTMPTSPRHGSPCSASGAIARASSKLLPNNPT